MAFVHSTKAKGVTIEDFRAVSAKHKPPQDIDGLLAWAAGPDENGSWRTASSPSTRPASCTSAEPAYDPRPSTRRGGRGPLVRDTARAGPGR